MIDTTTNERLTVTTPRFGGAYICLPEAQRAQVTALLDAHKVKYWVDEESLSLNGEPEVTWINLMPPTDPTMVQRLLDGTPPGYETINKMVLVVATTAMGKARQRQS
jgi:hypothetical protein